LLEERHKELFKEGSVDPRNEILQVFDGTREEGEFGKRGENNEIDWRGALVLLLWVEHIRIGVDSEVFELGS
jgi:hypothetical protein